MKKQDFKYGQKAYLKTDPYQCERIVTGVVIRGDSIMYELSYDVGVSTHYPCEISEEENVLTKVK